MPSTTPANVVNVSKRYDSSQAVLAANRANGKTGWDAEPSCVDFARDVAKAVGNAPLPRIGTPGDFIRRIDSGEKVGWAVDKVSAENAEQKIRPGDYLVWSNDYGPLIPGTDRRASHIAVVQDVVGSKVSVVQRNMRQQGSYADEASYDLRNENRILGVLRKIE